MKYPFIRCKDRVFKILLQADLVYRRSHLVVSFILLIEDPYCLIELIRPQGVIGLGLGVLINVDEDESINEQHGPDDVVMLPETK